MTQSRRSHVLTRFQSFDCKCASTILNNLSTSRVCLSISLRVRCNFVFISLPVGFRFFMARRLNSKMLVCFPFSLQPVVQLVSWLTTAFFKKLIGAFADEVWNTFDRATAGVCTIVNVLGVLICRCFFHRFLFNLMIGTTIWHRTKAFLLVACFP
jgi:hypothetical protein